MFSLIVLIHEWGHFISARKFWVKVEEFWLWIPPRAKKIFTDKKGTLFSLNWLPLGGFVKLKGETPNSFLIYDSNKKHLPNTDLQKILDTDWKIFLKDGSEIGLTLKQEVQKKLDENKADDNLNKKPAWQQAIIMLAWIFMNFLLALVLFSILFMLGVKPIGINTKIETQSEIKLIPSYEQAIDIGLLEKKQWIILNPIAKSPAETAGIKPWDILLAVNNQKINSPQEFLEYMNVNTLKKLTFSLQDSNCISCKDGILKRDVFVNTDGKIGTYISDNIIYNNNYIYNYWFFEAIGYWFLETKNQIILTFQGLWILLQKLIVPETPNQRQEAIEQVSGPIGIVDFVSSSLSAGFIFLVIIAAIISINLWVFNLLPIPALDWGRFLFILINSISQTIFNKKMIKENIESVIHVIFFLILIALSFIIAYNDINKIISN